MKTETETGYEPSLLLEMEMVRKSDVLKNSRGKPDKKARGFINRCIVLKDRTDTMNGRIIDTPKFKDFKPVIDCLNLGGEHVGVDTSRNSEDLFQNPDYSYRERDIQRQIALEELQQVLVLAKMDGTSA